MTTDLTPAQILAVLREIREPSEGMIDAAYSATCMLSRAERVAICKSIIDAKISEIEGERG